MRLYTIKGIQGLYRVLGLGVPSRGSLRLSPEGSGAPAESGCWVTAGPKPGVKEDGWG